MAIEENGFLEYLQLQDGEPDLVTKSELIARVRAEGYSVSDRQLTFYVTEGLLPRSVRVGSRAGAYPSIVVELVTWILRFRDGGLPIEALKELLPVWKFLIRARSSRELDLGELEYVARQHVTSVEGSLGVARVVIDVMTCYCPKHRKDIVIVAKDGTKMPMGDPKSTVGFAVARMPETEDADPGPRWFATTRVSLASTDPGSLDPTTVILGLKPNDPLPQAREDPEPEPEQGDQVKEPTV
ncbi:MerR family transcriptional regulator [Streptomyces niveus]